MADELTVTAVKPVETASVAPEPNLLETTTVKDGHLPINLSVPIVSQPSVTSPPTAVPVPETPILVTESEIAPSQTANTGLAEEVESLSGEIQALEAKIDRLTGNVKPVPETPKTDIPIEAPPKVDSAPLLAVSDKESTEKPSVAVVASSLAVPPSPTPSDVAVGVNKPDSKTVGINDIYSKIAKEQKNAMPAPAAPSADTAEDVGSESSIGTIGEVLAVFGIIIFLAMVAFPFYKSLFAQNISDAIRSIGHPTAVISLALGFLISLFGHGKALLKILTVILLLISVVLYLGVAGFQSYLGPLGPMLESVFTFYR